MKVAALAGGVGGAKLADGLARVIPPEALTVIVNTGDDFEHFGLSISPDLDTVCYTLAGLANPQTGWGRQGESWQAMQNVVTLGGPAWFQLGDQDLGTHLERTRRLQEGQSLTDITRAFCRAWGVGPSVLPMSDQAVHTQVMTAEGILAFQEYFVKRQCKPPVTGFRFEGIEQAEPAPGVLAALESAAVVIICPSNPWVSIDPILGLPGVRQALHGRQVWAVSPIVGGKTIKGPAAKMYSELGISPSALAVARHYGAAAEGGLLGGFVLDLQDAGLEESARRMGLQTYVTNTIMKTSSDRVRLAQEVFKFFEYSG